RPRWLRRITVATCAGIREGVSREMSALGQMGIVRYTSQCGPSAAGLDCSKSRKRTGRNRTRLLAGVLNQLGAKAFKLVICNRASLLARTSSAGTARPSARFGRLLALENFHTQKDFEPDETQGLLGIRDQIITFREKRGKSCRRPA